MVRVLERDGAGLNLTTDVLDGIACHTAGTAAGTLEGRVVRYCDKIAYLNHDFEDAARAGLIGESDVPWKIKYTVGRSKSERIESFVTSLISASADDIRMAPDVQNAFDALKAFMFEAVYHNPVAKGEEGQSQGDAPGALPLLRGKSGQAARGVPADCRDRGCRPRGL